MIKGVEVRPRKRIPDERGMIMHMLREDDDIYERFGEIYFSVGYPGIVKGWHYHKIQTDYFFVISGMMKLVLYDGRDDSPTKGDIMEFFLGDQNPQIVKIPPGVVHGFKAYGTTPAMLANCCTHPYKSDEPDEFRIHPFENDIPYNWDVRQG